MTVGEPENKLSAERKGFVSARDVAERAGVSRSAVSRAFTPGASVSEATRQKVQIAASELGYHVNDLARSLLTNRSRLVGLVVTRPEVGFRAHLTAALTKALIRRGSVPILINTGESESEMLAAQQALFGYRAEATIVLSGSPPAAFVELARQSGQPLIVLGRSEPEADHVRTDNRAAARDLAAMFVADGRKVLGLISAATGTPSVVERESAFQAEAERLGATVLVVRAKDADYAGGLSAADELFAADPRPQALFCVNDLLALGALDHLRIRLGLRVPADVAVVGFDDVPEAGWLGYGLTTFRQDPELMAAQAVAVLERRQENPSLPPIRRRLSPSLVIRQSFLPQDHKTA